MSPLEALISSALDKKMAEKPGLSKEFRARAMLDALEDWDKPNPFKRGDLVEPKPDGEFPGGGQWREHVLGVVLETFEPRFETEDSGGRANMVIMILTHDGEHWSESLAHSRNFRRYTGPIAEK